MKIGDVEKLTGLTQKAIRLYEKKQLVSVDRTSGDYRIYSDETVEKLWKIKNFRLAGIGLSRIKLWSDGIITAEELLKKRLDEIRLESEISVDMEKICREMLENSALSENAVFDEAESRVSTEQAAQLALGIDIGTTSISVSLARTDGFGQIEAYCIPGACDAEKTAPFAREQRVDVIIDKVMRIAESLTRANPEISVIGLTGQMHGIVYLDAEGCAVSNLITWQDERGNEKMPDGKTYAERFSELSGYPSSTGFGLVSHYYNIQNGLVPKNAVGLCTVMDYAVMKLCRNKSAVMHSTNASSLGAFDIKNAKFDEPALERVGISPEILPCVTDKEKICGYYGDIPVAVAVGDNQASFIGAVGEYDDCVLVNYGTGSQISFVGSEKNAVGDMELRPFVGGKSLVCGSALCGGRAYAVLEKFFGEYVRAAFGERKSQYDIMNALAKEDCDFPKIDTRFSGTRKNPLASGSIIGLCEKNFTPQGLVVGTLYGMANELYEMYECAGSPPFSRLVASGNAVRRNEALKRILQRVFGRELCVPCVTEEAAFGASKFAYTCLERMKNDE